MQIILSHTFSLCIKTSHQWCHPSMIISRTKPSNLLIPRDYIQLVLPRESWNHVLSRISLGLKLWAVIRSGGPSLHVLEVPVESICFSACHSMTSSEQSTYMKDEERGFPHPPLCITSVSLIITASHCEPSLQKQQLTRDTSLSTNSGSHFPKFQLLWKDGSEGPVPNTCHTPH